jgi:hypothetical protein
MREGRLLRGRHIPKLSIGLMLAYHVGEDKRENHGCNRIRSMLPGPGLHRASTDAGACAETQFTLNRGVCARFGVVFLDAAFSAGRVLIISKRKCPRLEELYCNAYCLGGMTGDSVCRSAPTGGPSAIYCEGYEGF